MAFAGAFGECPPWYPDVVASDRTHWRVAPWEWRDMPLVWRDRVLVAAEAEGRARNIKATPG